MISKLENAYYRILECGMWVMLAGIVVVFGGPILKAVLR